MESVLLTRCLSPDKTNLTLAYLSKPQSAYGPVSHGKNIHQVEASPASLRIPTDGQVISTPSTPFQCLKHKNDLEIIQRQSPDGGPLGAASCDWNRRPDGHTLPFSWDKRPLPTYCQTGKGRVNSAHDLHRGKAAAPSPLVPRNGDINLCLHMNRMT